MPDKPKKILLVEDERPMSMAMDLKLKHVGFETKTVFDGESAVKALETEPFDLVLLDLILPKLNGFGVLEAMRQKNIKTPVIVMSALGQEEDIVRAERLGAAQYFIKSQETLSKVVSQIRKILNIPDQSPGESLGNEPPSA